MIFTLLSLCIVVLCLWQSHVDSFQLFSSRNHVDSFQLFSSRNQGKCQLFCRFENRNPTERATGKRGSKKPFLSNSRPLRTQGTLLNKVIRDNSRQKSQPRVKETDNRKNTVVVESKDLDEEEKDDVSIGEFLKSASDEDKNAFRSALLGKLQEWKVLSESGALDTLSKKGKLHDEDIEEFDNKNSKLLMNESKDYQLSEDEIEGNYEEEADDEGYEEEEETEEDDEANEERNEKDEKGPDFLDAFLNYAVESLSSETTSPLPTSTSILSEKEKRKEEKEILKKFHSSRKNVLQNRDELKFIRQQDDDNLTNIDELSNDEGSKDIHKIIASNNAYILNKLTTNIDKKRKDEVFYYNLLLEIRDKQLMISQLIIEKILLGLIRLKSKDIQSIQTYNRLLIQSIVLYQQFKQNQLIAYPTSLIQPTTSVKDNQRGKKNKGSLLAQDTWTFTEKEEDEQFFFYTLLRNLYLSNPSNNTVNEEVSSLLFPSNHALSQIHIQLAKFLGQMSYHTVKILHESNETKKRKEKQELYHMVKAYLDQEFLPSLPEYTIEEVNDVIRVVGKSGLHSEIFQIYAILKEIQFLLQSSSHFMKYSNEYSSYLQFLSQQYGWKLDTPMMQSLTSNPSLWRKLKINAETHEYMITSFLLNLLKEEKSLTMKDLPSFNDQEPEIIVLGRSNVGKSSLINSMLNRKNLAKVSAVPGHTQAFHFYTLQRRLGWNESKNTSSESIFRLVDVPGLGYADTVEAATQEQWRELIIRYLTRRDHCKLVFHLIDARQPVLTKVDQEIIRISAMASKQRNRQGLLPYQYVLVLTKVDKLTSSTKGSSSILKRQERVDNEVIEQIQRQVNEIWQETMSPSSKGDVEEKDRTSTSELFDRIVLESRDNAGASTEIIHRREEGSIHRSQQKKIPVIQTSSLLRIGLDNLWKQILTMF